MIYLIYIVLLLAAALGGVWLGEDLLRSPLHVESEVRSPVVLITLAVIGLWGFFGGRPAQGAARFVMILSLCAAAAGGWFAGRHEATIAFNDCVERGEEVRTALARYHRKYKRYPESLEMLAMQNLPGKRLLRGNLLQYIGSEQRYRLMFRDHFVTHVASERNGFIAQK